MQNNGFVKFIMVIELLLLLIVSWAVMNVYAQSSSNTALMLHPTASYRYERITKWTEKILISRLLKDYDRRARPTVDDLSRKVRGIQQVTVEFGLSLIQIMKLDEMEQILTSNVRTLYRWPDYHLRWNIEKYENITHVHIPTDKIWLPDISIYNYADERLEERRQCDAIVKYDGTVEWHPMAIFKSTCSVRIKYFPFDRQCCKLKFGPWSYDGFRVNITFYDNKTYLDLSNYMENAEWNLLDSNAYFTAIQYGCCIEPYPDISFHVLIERNSAFYNYILILPCFLLSSLTLVLFWLPAESPAKMVLGMNIFIAFFLLVVLLEKSIPSASSSFPLIGTYYCVNMTLITMSTFLCLIIVNFHFRGDNRKEAPYWLKQLTIKHGARILMVDLGPISKIALAQPARPKPSTLVPAANTASANSYQDKPSSQSPTGAPPMYPIDPFYRGGAEVNPNHPQQPINATINNRSFSHNVRKKSGTRYQPPSQQHSMPPMLAGKYRGHNNIGQHPVYCNNIREDSPPDRISGGGQGLFYDRETPHTENSSCSCSSGCSSVANNKQYCPGGGGGANTGCYMEDDDLCALSSSNVILTHVAAASAIMNCPLSDTADEADNDDIDDDDDDDFDNRQIEADLNQLHHRQINPTAAAAAAVAAIFQQNATPQPPLRNYQTHIKDYEEDLEEFLAECIQSPSGPLNAPQYTAPSQSHNLANNPNELLNASWASYNSNPNNNNNNTCNFVNKSNYNTNNTNNHKKCCSQTANAFHQSKNNNNSNCHQHNYTGSPRCNANDCAHQQQHHQSNSYLESSHNTTSGAGGGGGIFVARRVNLITKDINDVIKDLTFIQKNNENRENVNRIVSEWRAVGLVLDRFFFMIYVFAIVLSLILFFPKAGNDPYYDEKGNLDCSIDQR